MTTTKPFDERLARARALLAARRADPLPLHAQDQVVAATAELQVLVAPVIDHWRASGWAEGTGEASVPDHLIAAALDCRSCGYLRRGGSQPMWALLALRLLVCRRCLHTPRCPPDDEADRCDICGSRGHTTFWAFHIGIGPAVFIGDAGSCCAEALGLTALFRRRP